MYIHTCHAHIKYLCICVVFIAVIFCCTVNSPGAFWLRTTTICHRTWIVLVQSLERGQLEDSSALHGINRGHTGVLHWMMGWCGGCKMLHSRVWYLGRDGWTTGSAVTVDRNICLQPHKHGSLRVLGHFTAVWLFPQSRHPQGTLTSPRKSQNVTNTTFILVEAVPSSFRFKEKGQRPPLSIGMSENLQSCL